MMTKPSHLAFMACEKAFSMLLFLDYFIVIINFEVFK